MLPKCFHLDYSRLKLLQGALPRKAKNKIETCPVLMSWVSQVQRQGLQFWMGCPRSSPVLGWKDCSHSRKEAVGPHHVSSPRAEPSCMEIFHPSREGQNLSSDKPIQGVHSGPGKQPSFVHDARAKHALFPSPPLKRPDAFSAFLSSLTR